MLTLEALTDKLIDKCLKLEKVYTESGQEQLNLLIFCFGGKVISF